MALSAHEPERLKDVLKDPDKLVSHGRWWEEDADALRPAETAG